MASVATTPPPHNSLDIHNPPTPKHGYEDSWEPYPPRKSARISSQKTLNQTPSPQDLSDNRHHQLRSPSSRKLNSASNMGSPTGSPQKKRQPAIESSRRISGSLTAEGTANAAAALGITSGGSSKSRGGSGSHSTRSAMLPTPAKTPARKSGSAQSEVNIQAIARNLFAPTDQAMPKSRKKASKGHVLDSFNVDEGEEPIQIYTDSHERVPEVDTSADNPFWGDQAPAPEPAKRRSKRKQETVIVPGEGERNVDEVVGREDGMVYVFRGKRKFYKRAENNVEEEEEDDMDETGADLDPKLRRPLTRSSIKPRLLFPAKKATSEANVEDDEEAMTDIDDSAPVRSAEIKRPHTPMDLEEKSAPTPKAPKFAPVSPPTTARATRSGLKSAEETTPMKPTRGTKRSPFDGWARTKNGSKDHGSKRRAESLEGEAAKRTRA